MLTRPGFSTALTKVCLMAAFNYEFILLVEMLRVKRTLRKEDKNVFIIFLVLFLYCRKDDAQSQAFAVNINGF